MLDAVRLTTALGERYHIERELGAGGMATVYLAQDLKHNRPVAIKVMHPELAAALGSERFLREIEIAARLNHPHILPLLDSGDADGFLFYVMPFADGQSLRQRLSKSGELPVPEAVRFLRDVVDALAHAHGHGVVHRDIKPENILLSGAHALVTDFGVAKAVLDATGQQRLTSEGMAIGTPAYMAPEQAVGDPNVDHRADIYAVGVVAYELLTGRPPFLGVTAQAVLSSHLADVPEDVTQLRPAAPPALGQMVMKCLAKKPADRYQSAEELLPRLDAVLTPSAGTTPTGTQPVAATRARRALPLITAALLVTLLGIAAWLLLGDRPLRLTTENAVPVTSESGVEYQPALSPDGSRVAFVAVRDGRAVLTWRSVRAGAGGELQPAASDARDQWLPRWSADGETLRFISGDPWAQGTVREVSLLGGAVRPVEVPRHNQWITWSQDGSRYVVPRGDSLLFYGTGDSTPHALAFDSAASGFHSCAWSPDNRRVACVGGNGLWPFGHNVLGSAIWLGSADNGRLISVTTGAKLNVSPVWLDASHLLFVSDRDGLREVYAVAVDRDGPRGEPQKVPGGTDAHSIAVSADGRRLAVARMTARANVWVYPIGPRPLSVREGKRVTSATQVVETFDVSPDGQWLVYSTSLGGSSDIYKVPLNGGAPIPLVTWPSQEFSPRWSPDGREIVFTGGPSNDVWVVSAEGGDTTQITHGSSGENAKWSPDGMSLAYWTSTRPRAIGLVDRSRVGGRWEAPRALSVHCYVTGWHPDGRGVFCRTGDADTLVLVAPTGTVLQRQHLGARGLTGTFPVISEDGTTFYGGAARAGRRGIWSWPVAGGDPRLVVAFNDQSLTPHPYGGAMAVRRGQLFLTVSEVQSDIWVMDLVRR